MEKLHSLRLGPLERVPSDDGSESPTVSDGTSFFKHVRVLTLGTARENDDASPIERTLDHMLDPLGQCLDRNLH